MARRPRQSTKNAAYALALGGISAALALLLVWLGVVTRYVTVAFFAAAGCAVTVPLTKRYWFSAVASLLVSAGLSFLVGDIADYEGVDQVDLVVTLHACDTATDYALERAVRWGAKVILSVPCCQHELNGQIHSRLLEPVMKYGLIRERMAALFTDAIRANLLEEAGYRVQVLEFIDMEHTPKNILLRAVRGGEKREVPGLCRMMEELHVDPTLALLMEKGKDASDE